MKTDLKCQVCDGESGGHFVGVACVPGAPVSVAWCNLCLTNEAVPSWIFEHDFIFVAGGDVSKLNEWATNRVTWIDGKYLPFLEYVKRITPEMVEAELKKFEELASREPETP